MCLFLNLTLTEGYLLALDDFVFHQYLKLLIGLVDLIKIDFRFTSLNEIEQYIVLV